MGEIIEVFEEQEIAISDDGMWNATSMCKKFNKRINNFLRMQQTKEYLEELKKKHNLSDEELVKVVQGKGKNQGTWVHRKVALNLAAWLNQAFAVWVFDVIEKLLTQGEVKLKDEIAELSVGE